MMFDRLKQLFMLASSSRTWPDVLASPAARIITGRGQVSIGRGTKLSDAVEVSTQHGGRIEIGENCEIHTGALLLSYGGSISIGNNCSVNPYCVLYGHGGLTIGSGVRIAAHTIIIPANHNYSDTTRPIYKQGLSKKGIKIEDDVWIGAGVRIVDGVTIGKGSVIGAGAVVTGDTPPLSVSVGVPARVVASRIPSVSDESSNTSRTAPPNEAPEHQVNY